MALVYTRSDDFDPTADDNVDETIVKITRGGVTRTFKADAGDANHDKVVMKPLGKFLAKATEVGTGQNSPEAQQDAAIRTWGRDHGYEVADRGRIKATVRSAYFDAHKDEEDMSNA